MPSEKLPPGPIQDDRPVALYLHCIEVYKAMVNDAIVINNPGDQEEADEIVIWEGMLTALITQELHLSVPYYTKITQALKRMGCIRQLKRGGGTAPSQWELLREPTEELFAEAVPLKKKPVTKDALYEERFANHERRLAVLEKALQRIIEEETNG